MSSTSPRSLAPPSSNRRPHPQNPFVCGAADCMLAIPEWGVPVTRDGSCVCLHHNVRDEQRVLMGVSWLTGALATALEYAP